MYNSEEIYTFEEEKLGDMPKPQTDSHKNQNFGNSRRKNNLNFTHKSNGILGTYTRIIPKKPTQDFERVYAENMQLKEKLRFLQEDNVKIKTRVSMVEKQKEQLITQAFNMDNNYSLIRDRRPSQKGFSVMKDKSKQIVHDENRKILHSYKDQISKLKLENGRLKKTVKYTQIQQLQTENQHLHGQLAKMKQYLQSAIEDNDYQQYEKQIDTLNRQLQGEKEMNRNMHNQMKKKDEQMEDVKNKMKVLASRKTQLQKKYTRDMNSAKQQLRVKDKQKQKIVIQDKKQTIKYNNSDKQVVCQNCKTLRETLQAQKSKNNELIQKINKKQKQLIQTRSKLNQLSKFQQDQAKVIKKAQNNEHLVQSNLSSESQKEKTNKQLNEQRISKQSKQRKQQIHKKNEKELIEDQENQEDQYEFDDDQQEQVLYKSDKLAKPEDKVDTNKRNLIQQQGNKKKQKNSNDIKQLKQSNQNYEESYNEMKEYKDQFQNGSEEEVLFQKEEKPKKRKLTQKGKTKEEEKIEKISGSKAQKILKQTIKYRLIAQRYSFEDFHRDIKDSQAKSFTAEQLIEMLSNQPFFLTQDHLKIAIYNLFQKDDLQPEDTIEVNSFLKKMKQHIGQIHLQTESQQEAILHQIQKKLKKKKIVDKLQQQAAGGNEISKKGFVKVLKQNGGLSDKQIQQCLAQASVMSTDIAHINYLQFIQKMLDSS